MDREKEDIIIDGEVYRFVRAYGKTWWVNQFGVIRGGRSRKIKELTLNKDGYLIYGIVRAHRLVALAWVDGWFSGAEVDHIDFNRTNNYYLNLRWITHKENVRHSVEENADVWNNSKSGVNNGRSTFTEEQVREIRRKYDIGMSIADILRQDHPGLLHAKDYKNLHSTYANICKRRTWKHIA